MKMRFLGVAFAVLGVCVLAGCGQSPRPVEPTADDMSRMYKQVISSSDIVADENPNNVLVNGNFETTMTEGASAPPGWVSLHRNLHDESTTFSLGLGRSMRGNSLQLRGAWSHIGQRVDGAKLQPFLGKKARISLWCRTSHPQLVPFMRLEVKRASNPRPSAFNIGLPSKMWEEAAGKGWTSFSSTVPVALDAEYLNVDLANKTTSFTLQNVMFDDVNLEPVH